MSQHKDEAVIEETLSEEETGRILESLQRLKRELLAARDCAGDPAVRVRGATLIKDEPYHVYMGAIVESDPVITAYASHPRLVGMAEEDASGLEQSALEVLQKIVRVFETYRQADETLRDTRSLKRCGVHSMMSGTGWVYDQ